MTPPSRLPHRQRQALRAQLAAEIGLTLLAVAAALLVLRVAFKLAEIGPRVWSGAALYRLTEPLVLPLALLPGGARPILGAASLADITAAVSAIVVPLFLLSRHHHR